MAPRGDTYSRFVGWLKLLLPLAALALLSTLFLLPRGTEPTIDLPFMQGSGSPGREQIVGPNFAGTTAKGDQLRLTAERAEPVDGALDRIRAFSLDAALDMADGSRVTLRSAEGLVDENTRSADLEGAVEITSTTGYVMTTERMRTALDRIEAETLAPVSGKGPAGEFTAGRLVITGEESSDDVQLLFTDGVKLVYDPKDP
ncbi:hypothetical protein GCM10011415_17120 [Salipiger pallidus]|uniref:Lipopolysaccharide export system protein LptC n=1 Tax=Salipiger pallidus TaxID=1775170 RepID=A0A8J3EFH5_9RHOB|nr:LPS export ABC transporter periplasmic protein LptC [Salipiger pallidus]GGG70159.1 hypothetical protein GCM10011415_17120 [Salipiger pallidus]